MGKTHHFIKKNFINPKIILSAILIFLLMGCKSNQQQTSEELEITKTYVTISVDAGLVTTDFRKFVNSFSSVHDIEIRINERPSGSAGENEVMTELLAGNTSDILLFNSGGLFKMLDPQEYFYDLSDEEYPNQYIDSYLKAVSVEDKVYGLPMGNADAIGFIYRKDIYADLELSLPEDWETFESNLEQIKAANITPLLTPFKDQWLTQYYWYVAEQFDEPDNLEHYSGMLERIDSLKSKGFLSPNLLTTSFAMGLNDLGNKKSAHLLGQYNFINYLTSNHVVDEENIGFFPLSDQNKQYIYMLPSSLYINKDTEELKTCLVFFQEYYEKRVVNKISSKEQPGILLDAEVQPNHIIYEQQMNYKVDILPELLLDYFMNNLTADELIHQYKQRNNELKLIYY